MIVLGVCTNDNMMINETVLMVQLLRGETSCFESLRSGFTDLGSTLGQGKIINIPVFYHETYLVVVVLLLLTSHT